MKIEHFEYHDKSRDWKLEKTSFSDLNLLVGISGVGKTQILRALMNIQRISEGLSLNGIKWEIVFSTNDGIKYLWCGEFDTKEYFVTRVKDINKENPLINEFEILTEFLFKNGKEIVRRTQQEIVFEDQKTPKLSSTISAISLLKREDSIKPVNLAFQQVFQSVQQLLTKNDSIFMNTIVRFYDSFEKIQESKFGTWVKLSLIYKFHPNEFERIKERFIEIFPQVTDIKYEFHRYDYMPQYVVETPILKIKEKSVSSWIDQSQMSNGMLRTLNHIAEIYLCPEGSVILIDEFENSLGVNCIDVITDDILNQNRDLQFIITSHHPYIINNIPPKYWKIVQRKGGVVTTHDAASLGLSGSNHEAFIQLINSEKFREGIEAA